MNGSCSSSRLNSSSASSSRLSCSDCCITTRQAVSCASTSQPSPSRSMRVLSLRERIDLLESDLRAVPPRISVYRDLPFAILRYEPDKEWDLRRELRLLEARLDEADKHVR